MSIALMGGIAALVLALVVGVVVTRRRRPADKKVAAPDEVAVTPAEPLRRRTIGASLIAGSVPVSDAELDPEPELLDPLPAEPRRKIALGLTPWDAAEPAVPAAADDDDEVDAPRDEDEEDRFGGAAETSVDRPDETPLVKPQRMPIEDIVEPGHPSENRFVEVIAPPIEEADPPSILAQLKTKKQSLPGALAGAAEGGASAAPTGPSEVEERVSIVLRRQVPARLDEAPRSWLGGLPMMPDHVEWPRSVSPERLDEGEASLHFVAQIACADFPPDLWGGVGPRSGWLLFFLNPLDSQGDDPRVLRVIHIDELGAERQPPEDLCPVQDEELADGDFLWCRSAAEIPSTFRRWPVDLVSVPNEAHDDGYRMAVTPKNFASKLYEGASVASGSAEGGGEIPFSWRGALYVIDSVLRQLTQPQPTAQIGPALREALDRPGYVASLIPELRARETDWLHEGEGAILLKEEPLRERERELRDRLRPIAEERQLQLDRLAAFIVENPNAAAIAKRIAADSASEAEWRAAAAERLEAIRAQILARPLDTLLGSADWATLSDNLAAERQSHWTVEWASRNSDFPVMVVEQERSLLDLAGAGLDAAAIQLAADYQADPALRALVPPALIERLEPHWRSLTDNRPHRIGGFHDGLQSEPEDGPQSEVLLLQLASDDAMHWMWGDGGAYFIFISPRDLAAGLFERAEIRLEQP